MYNHSVSTCISTNNNLNYLKLAIKSIRQNCYYKDQPIIVFAENCTDGTNEWLQDNEFNVEFYIENNPIEKGIGGGMNFCVDKANTEFVNIIHSDMWVAPNQDIKLLKLFDDVKTPLIASSYRIQPKIFPNDPWVRPGAVFFPPETFGEYYHNFKSDVFDEWAKEFSYNNDVKVRKGGGAGFMCRKKDFVSIGGNDPIFAPASWEDMDLFVRMQLVGYEFIMTTKSVVYHFSARGSHFKNDDLQTKSDRQIAAEQKNIAKFINKWGRLPEYDESTFVKPIYDSSTNPIMNFKKNLHE